MSEKDRLHVQRHMDSRQQCEPPANPAKVIAVNTQEVTADDADEALDKRKAKLNKGRKGGNKGAFDKLRKDLAAHEAGETVTKTMPTAAATTTSKPEIVRMNKGLDQAVMLAKLKAGPTAAETPTDGALLKALVPAFDKAAKTLGVTNPLLKSDAPVGSTSLESTYNSDSATLTGGDALRKQSLRKRKPTNGELLKAASNALNAGKITAAEAMHLEYACNMGKEPDEALVGKLGLDK